MSDVCVNALRPYFGDARFDIVPNGVDTELYRPLGPGETRPPGPPRILFMGRFDPRNGLDTLLEAARILQDEGRDFVVQVVGDGPLRRKYHHQARSLGVWDRIEWLGLLDKERPRLYREATVFASPCVLASFGVVLLEAMASGTPVVCADNVGFRQVIRDGAPGRFVRPRDARDLATGLAELLDDAATRAGVGRGGPPGRGRALLVAAGGGGGRGPLSRGARRGRARAGEPPGRPAVQPAAQPGRAACATSPARCARAAPRAGRAGGRG